MKRLCGVDEAGRGPLAGPVYAAAVILAPGRRITGLADSKALTAQQREDLAHEIRARAAAWAVASARRSRCFCRGPTFSRRPQPEPVRRRRLRCP